MYSYKGQMVDCLTIYKLSSSCCYSDQNCLFLKKVIYYYSKVILHGSYFVSQELLE